MPAGGILPGLPTCFTCSTLSGQCSPEPDSTLLPGDCTDTCKCAPPRNCGQLNGTTACGKQLNCNVCDTCCQPFIATQAQCDLCVFAPDGCNGTSAAPAWALSSQ
jgi:hypothetical protein